MKREVKYLVILTTSLNRKDKRKVKGKKKFSLSSFFIFYAKRIAKRKTKLKIL